MLHGLGHQHRLLGVGDGRVHQHRLAAHFHGDGGVGGSAHARIDQHRNLGFLKDDLQVVGVADTQAGTDQTCQWHDRDAAGFGQLTGDDRVVAGVDHHVETILDQHFGGLEGFDHIGEQGLLVGQDFQFDQVVTIQQLAGQTAGAHGFDGVVAAGGVGQDGVAVRRQHVEQVRLARVLTDVGTAHGDGDDLGTRGLDGQAGFFHVTVLAGADQQARLESTPGQGEGLVATNVAHGCSSGKGCWACR
ncbi:hypothetical protein D3C79_587960 [compost metagenome]